MIWVRVEDDDHCPSFLWENKPDISVSGCGGNQSGGEKVLDEPASYRRSPFLPKCSPDSARLRCVRNPGKRGFAVDDH
jgi:hypothetical protein